MILQLKSHWVLNETAIDATTVRMISHGYPPDTLMIQFWNREPIIIDSS